MKKALVIAAMMSVLAGCAATTQHNASNQAAVVYDYVTSHQLQSLEKITAFKFQGWRSLDNKHLIISTSHKRPYLIALQNRCNELRHARGIAINANGTNTLHAGFDSITVPQFPQRKCFIKSIYRLTKEQADEVTQLAKKPKV